MPANYITPEKHLTDSIDAPHPASELQVYLLAKVWQREQFFDNVQVTHPFGNTRAISGLIS